MGRSLRVGSGWAALLLMVSGCSENAAEQPPILGVLDSGATANPDAGAPAPQADATTPSLDSAVEAGPSPSLDSTTPRPDTGTTDTGAVVADTGVADTGPSPDAGPSDAFAACVAKLKPKCSYDDKETACSSTMTAKVPLTAGGFHGDVELKGGPYGAYVEWNEGKAFANPVNIGEYGCDLIASTFGEPASVTQDVLNLRGQELSLYTVFRPACTRDGDKYPVITWGNGTCGQSGGYAGLLAAVASHGFVVIAANSRFTDAGNKEMTRALDFAKAINEDSANPLFGKLDLSKVGAMGHSQGGSATVNAASDPRIKSVILWNGGGSAVKPFLAISGERDIGNPTPATMASAVNAAAQPGAWLFFHKVLQTGGNFTGHLTLMMQPERVIDVTVAWWKYQLNGDAEAKKQFVGTDCGLCNKKDEYEFGMKGLQ